MRLFGKVDGDINRYDRAGWLTPPFDYSLLTDVALTCEASIGPRLSSTIACAARLAAAPSVDARLTTTSIAVQPGN